MITCRIFFALLEQERLPIPTPEHRFDAGRRWRMDYAWQQYMVALEVEGGVWTQGRHTRGAGFLADMEKYNAAAVLGWRIIRCTPDDLLSIKTIVMVRCALTMASEPWDALIVKGKK